MSAGLVLTSLEPEKLLMKAFPSPILAMFHRCYRGPLNHLYTTFWLLEGDFCENLAHHRQTWAMQYGPRRTGTIPLLSKIPYSPVNNDGQSVFKISKISYLSYVREQDRKVSSLPVFLLPCIQLHSDLLHHSRRISFPSELWIAVHTSYPVAHHFLDLVVSPRNQSPFPISFAARKYLSGRRCPGGRVHQDPKRDTSIACQCLIGEDTFSAEIGFERETPTPTLTVESPRRQLLGGSGMYEGE